MTNVTRNTRNEAEAVAPTLMFIGGAARESADGTCIDVENPANHTVVGRVPRAADADVDAAVHAAAGAFDEWRAVAPRDRGRALVQIADALPLTWPPIDAPRSPSRLHAVLELHRGLFGMLQRHRRHRDEPIGVLRHPLGETVVLPARAEGGARPAQRGSRICSSSFCLHQRGGRELPAGSQDRAVPRTGLSGNGCTGVFPAYFSRRDCLRYPRRKTLTAFVHDGASGSRRSPNR